MLDAWGTFNWVESATWVRVAILLALMICVVWVTFRTKSKSRPGVSRAGGRDSTP
jgi:hypothetical protein